MPVKRTPVEKPAEPESSARFMYDTTPLQLDTKEDIQQKYPDTPPEVFNIEKTYEEAEEHLTQFVSKQIELMKENLLFGGQNVPSSYALNK
jgi:hypothetical protein